ELESVHVMSPADLGELLNDQRTAYSENFVYLPNQDINDETAARLIHRALVDSSDHRSNMLNSNASEVGVGIIKNHNGWYVVQSFFET
ncbi:MAG: CAP domain-containing protein, partial [Planctomycetota bacterium]